MIFHLEMQVYVNKYGDLCDRDSFYSDVYTSYEIAYEKGIQELNRRIIELKEADAHYYDETVDTFIKEMINYKFVIHELIILEEQEELINKMMKLCFKTKVEVSKDTNLYELCRKHSSSIDYKFDYLGNIIERVEFRGMGYFRMPSDYEEDAGIRFTVGDVVRVVKELSCYQDDVKYFVVADVPGRLRDAENIFMWENVYALDFVIIEEGKILKTYDTFFEHQIEKVEDETICRQLKKLISEAEYKYNL
ncbi:hypothetical protein DFR55_12917 [Herbinix hemicellulosilytica]|uniref:Uncharacterized protein n=1 Tax=Herbinix hemicellulosilytica TaxID=1564487 RepID=A0A0H5SHW8_HERHM|nr:hypothetical protein [Herbinix hemicellulosilytica]RBP57078.1 hypothetical protein DFR55_12917 [Herbinix hemicellulosilytica]CRZ35087.1 hypothetical protein HHT355_1888 [Herbinix hemicellulosilytica]